MTAWAQQAKAIAAKVVTPWAAKHDRAATFPTEAMAALRSAGLLSLPVPTDAGGPGGSLVDVTDVLRVLGGADASLGVIMSMHYGQIAVMARHGHTPEMRQFLKAVDRDQLLIANCNSEKSVASTDRRSIAALEPRAEGGYDLEKETPVISYAENADAILITVRRSADARPSEQVLALAIAGDIDLIPLGEWDTLGLRSTCSRPFRITAKVDEGMIIDDYRTVLDATGLPVAHLLAAAACLGVAEGAVGLARAYVRTNHRGQGAVDDFARRQLAEMLIPLESLRGLFASAMDTFARVDGLPAVGSLAVIMQLQTLKVATTRLTSDIAVAALSLCGPLGYRDDGPLPLGRILRDATGMLLMVSNDSLLGENGNLALVRKVL